MTEVSIGNSLETIGNDAFSDCYRINTIRVSCITPPSCQNNVFNCSSSGNSQNDIYNYANLHVPSGTKEIYSSAYDWRNFKKIKDDITISSIEPLKDNSIRVYCEEGILYIKGASDNSRCQIFSLDGKIILSETLQKESEYHIAKGAYVVRVDDETFKLKM